MTRADTPIARPGVTELSIVSAFAAATFLSAFLLFGIEPMFAKMAIPMVGGSPAIWTTAVLFFQLVLLASYAYVHVLRSLPRSWTFAIHAALVLLVLARLPLAIPGVAAADLAGSPIVTILRLLTIGAGLPFFALSATSPLLQLWLSRTDTRAAANPYPLYAASNLGSLLGLLAYPLVVEPFAGLHTQVSLWGDAYVVFGVLLVASFLKASRRWAAPSVDAAPTRDATVTPRRRMRWVLLAFVPSSIMLGMTAHVSMMIAPMPLLWTLPLALYLSTFVIAFSPSTQAFRWAVLRAAPFVVLVTAVLFALHAAVIPLPYVALHLTVVFLLALACHGALADDRPTPAGLTDFYLMLSVGGALGGIFNAIAAPFVFPTIAEYPIAIVLACAAAAFYAKAPRRNVRLDLALPLALGLALWAPLAIFGTHAASASVRIAFVVATIACFSFSRHRLRFALGICAMLAAGTLVASDEGRQLAIERNFFGVKTVSVDPTQRFTLFVHNSTVHGIQSVLPERAREPLSYYAATGPLGSAFSVIRAKAAGAPLRVSAAGLGIGSVACYARPGDDWRYLEIDPAVVDMARRSFSFLSRCTPQAPVIVGDARISLEAPQRPYDVIVLDAYTSDSPPLHMLSREAFALYLSRLRPNGFLLFNISNRYFDLEPVLAAEANATGMASDVLGYSPSPADAARGAFASTWMVVGHTRADLTAFEREAAWHPARARPNLPLWTDDYASLLRLWMPG